MLCIWRIFENTGNIEAYLYLKECNGYTTKKEEDELSSAISVIEVKHSINQ